MSPTSGSRISSSTSTATCTVTAACLSERLAVVGQVQVLQLINSSEKLLVTELLALGL